MDDEETMVVRVTITMSGPGGGDLTLAVDVGEQVAERLMWDLLRDRLQRGHVDIMTAVRFEGVAGRGSGRREFDR